jgi:phage gp29-like protein
MEYPDEENGIPLNKADQMLEFVQGLQSGHSLVLPSTTDHHGRYQWDVSIIADPTTQHNFTSAIDFVHEIIRTGLCVPKLASSSEVTSGTYNLGAAQLQQHNENIQYTLESLATALNKYLMKPFTRWNFGPDVDPVRIEFAPISTDIQIMLLQGLIAQLSSGVDVMDPDGNQLIVDWTKVAEDGGLPILKKDQRRELLDLFRQRQQELEAMQPSEPAPPPTAEAQMEPEQPPTEEVPTA